MCEREAAIVKIALCGKYQAMYSNIDTAGRNAGLYDYEIEDIKRWKYHDIGQPIGAIVALYDYFEREETERFDKSVYLYNKDIERLYY